MVNVYPGRLIGLETAEKIAIGLILTIIPYKIFPARSGGEKCIAGFTRYLARREKLISITVRANDPSMAEGYPMFNLLTNHKIRYINILYFFTIQRYIRKYKVSYVMLEHPYYGWLGWMLKYFTGVKLVVHSHNIESLRWKSIGKWWWRILYYYEKWTHRKADLNFFIQDNDKEYAITHFKLDPGKCTTITYGVDIDTPVSPGVKKAAGEKIRELLHIPKDAIIYLFNGVLNYQPNTEAVNAIVTHINPILLSAGFPYRIIICGKGLPARLNDLKEYESAHIIYAGFVEDIDMFFKGADIFINPVTEGGGIKTKLVEAIGWGTRSVSTVTGAAGVNLEDAGEQLLLAPDGDWQAFAAQMLKAKDNLPGITPPSFYTKFYWGNIAEKAGEKMVL